jgi:hypothetical protein
MGVVGDDGFAQQRISTSKPAIGTGHTRLLWAVV